MLFQVLQVFIHHFLNFRLMKPINIKERFGTSDGWYIKNNSKMTSISTVKFMHDPITVDHDKLRPVLWMRRFEVLEEFEGRWQLAEG